MSSTARLSDRLFGWGTPGEEVKAQLVEHRYGSTRLPVLLANLVVASAVAVSMLGEHPLPLLLGWVAAVSVVMLLIIWSMTWYADHRHERTPDQWALRFTLGGAANGLVWGLGAFLFFDPTTPTHNIFMVAVICGMTAGQVVTAFAVPTSTYAFLVPAILLAMAMPLTRGGLIDQTLALLWLPYFAIMVLLTRSAHNGLAASIQLGHENARLAEHLSNAKERAEHLARAKADFLATMSHEIRTPMHGMLGVTELLSSSNLDAKQKVYLEHLRGTGEYLSQLLNNILDFSKIDAEKLVLNESNFSLAEVAGEALSLFALPATRKGLILQAPFPDHLPPTLRGDPHRLKQVLVNLLSNAFKFTDFGTITLEVTIVGRDPDRVLLRFRVIDTGTGISPDLIPSIFDPFTQENPAAPGRYAGTGLGLAISQRLVQAMGGQLTLESRLGHGSAFAFTLPFAIASQESPSFTAPLADSDTALSGIRVLLADDTHLNRLVVREFLAPTSCVVDEAEDGAEALKMFQANGYHVVLMDMRMPVMDGLESVRQIRLWEAERQRTPVPIIMLTANAFDSDRLAVMAAGCTTLLQKPVQKAALVGLLRKSVKMDGEKVFN